MTNLNIYTVTDASYMQRRVYTRWVRFAALERLFGHIKDWQYKLPERWRG